MMDWFAFQIIDRLASIIRCMQGFEGGASSKTPGGRAASGLFSLNSSEPDALGQCFGAFLPFAVAIH